MPVQQRILIVLGCLLWAFGPMAQAEDKKIVLVAGRQSHGPGDHEFNAGCLLLQKCLNRIDGIDATVVHGGWPEDESVFNDADAVLFFMDGGGRHPVIQENRLQIVDQMADRGVGLGFAHYGVEVPEGDPGRAMQKWIGGYYEHQFSCNPMWTPEFKSFPKHPVTRGVKPFRIKDEWYINMRFRSNMGGIVPILSAPPSDDVRNGPYVWPKGPYEHIQKNKGRSEIMMWVVENPNGGRGFGFTGGHIHRNWGNENFRKVMLNGLVWLAKAEVPEGGVPSTVTEDDLWQGLDPKWVPLFDGTQTGHLRGYRQEGFPDKAWKVVDGILKTVPGVPTVDLVTRGVYRDFELEYEWKVSPGGNSGVMYNVIETSPAAYYSGPEAQVLDDSRHPDGRNPLTSAGSLYALKAPNDRQSVKPVGEFNTSKIIVQDGFVEHWLNGEKVVEYEWGSHELAKMVAGSKFSDWPMFMSQHQGRIAFQHHGEEVWYRNIRIRRLSGAPANTLTEKERAAGWHLLFNGRDGTGWRGFKKDAFPKQGWVVDDGVLKHLARGGGGDIITDRQFSDYEFEFEWLVTPRANSGVKYFITESRGGPIGHEYQVLDDDLHPDAKVGPHRHSAAFYDVLPVEGNKFLNPVGRFNRSKIVVDAHQVEHWLNGYKVLSYELGSDRLKEAIANSKFRNVDGFGTKYDHHLLLQDHQDEVWYRNMKIRPL